VFSIELGYKAGDSVIRQLKPEELDFETTQEMIMFICEAFDDIGCCSFIVKGFGDEWWPVDVFTDLAVLVEQLNLALQSIKNFKSFVLDFYEQGLERKVNFEYRDGIYKINCISLTDWEPTAEGDLESAHVELELSKFKERFVELAEKKLPQLSELEMFQSWRVSESNL
jgi:hypothetical protein